MLRRYKITLEHSCNVYKYVKVEMKISWKYEVVDFRKPFFPKFNYFQTKSNFYTPVNNAIYDFKYILYK